MTATHAVAVGLPILLGLGVMSQGVQQNGMTSAQQTVVVELSQQWVPFSATIVYSEQGRVHYGKFYRSSNGSNATINESQDGLPVITIHNFSVRQTFARLGAQGWVTYPLAESQSVRPKPRISVSARRLRQLDTAVAGAPVYEFKRTGGLSRLAAGLNGFPVYLEELDGRTVEFTDIALGEPPASVFVPPPGVTPKAIRRP